MKSLTLHINVCLNVVSRDCSFFSSRFYPLNVERNLPLGLSGTLAERFHMGDDGLVLLGGF